MRAYAIDVSVKCFGILFSQVFRSALCDVMDEKGTKDESRCVCV